jgi:hypothetical protein
MTAQQSALFGGLQAGDLICKSNPPPKDGFFQIVGENAKSFRVRPIEATLMRSEGCWDDTGDGARSPLAYIWSIPDRDAFTGEPEWWAKGQSYTRPRTSQLSNRFRHECARAEDSAVFFACVYGGLGSYPRAHHVKRESLLKMRRGNWHEKSPFPAWWYANDSDGGVGSTRSGYDLSNADAFAVGASVPDYVKPGLGFEEQRAAQDAAPRVATIVMIEELLGGMARVQLDDPRHGKRLLFVRSPLLLREAIERRRQRLAQLIATSVDVHELRQP